MSANLTYESLIGNLQAISSIVLEKLNLEGTGDMPDCPLKANIGFKIGDYGVADGLLTVRLLFSVDVVTRPDGDSLFSLGFTYRVEYQFDHIELFAQDMIELFVRSNVAINIWPFARELISSLTTRMGYPALLVEPLKHVVG